MMWAETFTRSQFTSMFVDLLNDRPVEGTGRLDHLREPQSNSVLALWEEDDRQSQFPNVFVVRDGELPEFLAWLTTFFDASFKPFTSHFEVIPWHFFKEHFEKSAGVSGISVRRIPKTPTKIRSAWIGAIMGELLTESKSLRSLAGSPVQAFASTCSFAFARSLFLYERLEDPDLVLNRWLTARELTQQKARTIPPRLLFAVWNALGAVQGNAFVDGNVELSFICLACQQIFSTGLISESLWDQHVHGVSHTILSTLKELPREDGFEALEMAARMLMAPEDTPMQNAFVLGYLASLLGNQFEYAELLLDYLGQSRSLLIWYGICSGLRTGHSLIDSVGGIGRRILREVERPFLLNGRPEADVSLDELGVLVSTRESPSNFPRSSIGALRVEILPGVITTVNYPAKRESAPEQVLNEKTRGTISLQETGLSTIPIEEKLNQLTVRVYENTRQMSALHDAFDQLKLDLGRSGQPGASSQSVASEIFEVLQKSSKKKKAQSVLNQPRTSSGPSLSSKKVKRRP